MQKIYDPSHYRVIFISSAPIGIPFLEQLVKDPRFEVCGIVTQPDKPIGRGLKLQANSIKARALELGIGAEDIQTPYKINPDKSLEGKNLFDRMIAKKPDFLVVIAYGKIIPQTLLDIPVFWPINVHGSLLPKYRWASPIQSVFLNQETHTGITIMHMDAGMDTGNSIAQISFPIPFDWTCLDCIKHMQAIGPKFLNQTLRKYAKNEISDQEQDHSQALVCGKIEKSDGLIDPFRDTLDTIYAKYRAYYLRPKIFFLREGKNIIIEQLQVQEELYSTYMTRPLIDEKLQLNPAISSLLLKPQGKKVLDRKSFQNGYFHKEYLKNT